MKYLLIIRLINKGLIITQRSQNSYLQQQTFILSFFWKLEARDQCVGCFGFFQGLSPWAADGPLLVMTLRHCALVSVLSGSESPLLIRIPVILDQGPSI